MRKLIIFILFFLFSFSLYASVPPVLPPTVATGVYPIPSTLEEVSEGVWIVQGTDGRTYQVSEPDEDGSIRYQTLTGKYDWAFDMMQDIDEYLKKYTKVPSLGSTGSSGSSDSHYKPVKDIINTSGLDTSIIEDSKGYVMIIEYTDTTKSTVWSYSIFYGIYATSLPDSTGRFNFEAPSSSYSYFWYESNPSKVWFTENTSPYVGTLIAPINRYDVYTNIYNPDVLPPSSSSDGFNFNYTGWGDPWTDVAPEDDPYNPDNPNYNPQLIQDVQNSVLQLNMRIKIDWSEFWPEFDKRYKPNNITIENNDIFNLDDIDFEKELSSQDSWFVKLLKAILKFIKSIFIPSDVQIVNSDGSTKKENYFVYNLKDMTNDFSKKFNYDNYTNKITNLTLVSTSDEDDDTNTDTGTSTPVLDDGDFGGYVNFSIWKPYMPKLQDFVRGFIYCMLVIYNVKMAQVLIRVTSPISTGKDG